MKKNFSLLAIIVIFITSTLQANGQQRCSVNPCTAAYCQEKWPDTWNSSENFDNYGYTKLVLANNSCLPCSYNCLKCSSQTSCNTCATSYYEETPKCNLCQDRCLVCTVVNSINRCYQCEIGSYLDTLDENCKSCPQGAYQCTSYESIVRCKTGYKQQNSLYCAKCPDNCLTCNLNSSQCQKCDTSYMLNTTSKQCIKCNSNCQKCTLFQSKNYCTVCATSYIAVSGNCSSCPSNCQYCSSVSVCGKCKQGYNIVGGGCQAVSSSVKYCMQYSGASCTKCISGYFIDTSVNKCYPCSLTCSSCFGRHFGNCQSCNSVANLFNQMCIVINFPTRTTYQGYYSFPYAEGQISSGSLGCNGYFYSGSEIDISLNNLASGSLTVQWKIYTIGSTASYTASINSINNTFTSQTNSFTYCGKQYYLSIQTQIFNDIKQNNTLKFAAIGGVQLALEQMIYTAIRCNDLCLECTDVACTKCLTSNLYTQDAYCVYSCSNGYYTYQVNKTCIKQCPLSTYPRSTDQSCQACTSPCYSCSSDIFCLSCVSGYYLSSGGQCVQTCPKLYYGKIQTKTCESCVGNCYQCLSEIQCINCRIGFFYSSNKSCIDNCSSIAGYYSNVTSLSCSTCDSSCLNCSQLGTKCIACQSTKVFYDFHCLDTCPSSYFNNSNMCTECTYPCQNCLNENLCLSCFDRYLLNNTCLISCPDKYYEDNVKLTCELCDTKCSKCLFQASNCLQCNTGYYYYNFKCYSDCPSGYYQDSSSKFCLPCTGLCWQCSNQTSCLSCQSNFLLNISCVGSSSCGNGLYADIKTLSCKICSSPCLTCQYQATLCTSCSANSSTPYLQNSTCVSSCLNNYVYASSDRICVACQSPCEKCLNETACLSCITGYKYSNYVCSSQCSVGTFFNNTISECQSCSNNCLICNSASFCQLCANSYYIQSNSSTEAICVSSCPNLYYGNFLTSSCQNCLYPCLNCQSSIDCLSCQTGVLYSKRCIGNCPDSTFLSNNNCIECQGNCLTCQISATTCKICKDGFYLKGTQCLSICPDGYYAEQFTKTCQVCPSTCSKCLNNTYCTQCIINKSFMGASNVCIENCPSGQYGDNITSSCKSCNSKCLTCSGTATNCLSCALNYFLVRINSNEFDCQLSCPDYYYNQGNVCYACIFPCERCSSSITCLSCVNGTLFYATSHSCLSTCPLQTYQSSGACSSCSSPCINCLNKTYCLSCSSGLLYNGNCVSQCPSNHYADDTGICNQCYGYCKTCSSKYYCLTCNAGYAYKGYCYSSCPPGTYGNSSSGACLSCSSPCLQCSASATYCTRCMNNQFAYKGACSDTCPQTTFVSSRQCISCTFPCLSCVNQYTCSSCVGGYLLYLNKSCILLQDGQNCPNDYYKKDSVACVPLTWCPENYYIDQVLRTCSKACPREKYTDVVNKKCVYACPQNYYAGQNLICKDLAAQPPSSLLQMKAISFIKSSKTHIEIQFSQQVQWLQNPSKAYSFTALQSRLLSTLIIGSDFKVYLIQDTQFEIALINLPYRVSIHLPAYYVNSAVTSLPLQNPNITVRLPQFEVYQHDNLYTGQIMGQLSEGISWLILLISFIFLFINRLSDIYILWDTAQLLYVLLFLEIQYPPSLNQFFLGLQNTHLNFIPTIFSPSNVRSISDRPFYAYSYDNNFLRTAGHSVLIIIIVLAIYIILKICQLLIRKVGKINQCMKNYPKIRRFIYRGLLRYRWHHASDLFFITYLNILMFGIAQVYFISQNPNRIPSNVLCIILCIVYILFPIFVGYKLYKHYRNISKGKNVNNLKCFYRGIQKQNGFGISMIILRYIRKMIYAIVIAIFSSMPMYALPILMFTSVMLGLFIFLNRPFKKRLSNIVTIFTEICLVIVFILIALIEFLKQQLSHEMKQSVGWICSVILTITLLVLIYQIFCKTLFYLQPQNDPKTQPGYDPLKDQAYIRKKAGQFFDSLMPQLREHFNLDDSQDQIHEYEEGDSQDSQNNDLREKGWGISSQNQSSNQQFKHYGQSSSGSQINQKSGKKIPNYLIRCVKDLK